MKTLKFKCLTHKTKRTSYRFLLFCILCLYCSCKTQKAPPVILKHPVERQAVIQVCDKFQLSYQDLPCMVYFSDGKTELYKTNIDGKIIIRLEESQKIVKLIYDFTNYKRKTGEILAINDFMSARKLKFNPGEKFAEIETYISEKAKTLFILMR